MRSCREDAPRRRPGDNHPDTVIGRVRANSDSLSGVRAEMILTSCATPSESRMDAASRIVSQSDGSHAHDNTEAGLVL